MLRKNERMARFRQPVRFNRLLSGCWTNTLPRDTSGMPVSLKTSPMCSRTAFCYIRPGVSHPALPRRDAASYEGFKASAAGGPVAYNYKAKQEVLLKLSLHVYQSNFEDNAAVSNQDIDVHRGWLVSGLAANVIPGSIHAPAPQKAPVSLYIFRWIFS